MKPIIVPARDAARAVRARPTNGASADGRNVSEPNDKTVAFDHVGYRLRCRRCGAVGSGSIWPQGHVWAHGRTDAAIRASQPPPPSPDGGARRALAWLKAVADGQIAPARRSGGSWRAR